MQQSQSGQTVQMRTEMRALICAEALVQALQQMQQALQPLVLVQLEQQQAPQRRGRLLEQWLPEQWLQAWVQGLQGLEQLEPLLTRALAESQARREQVARTQREQMTSVRTWAEAQAEAGVNGVTYGEVLADPILMVIIYSIKPVFRRHLDNHLWPNSHKYWWFIQIMVPITRLPLELLQQILLILIDNASDPPFVLMRVSKLWYNVVAGIWALLKLGTKTPKNAITTKLERNQWFLDVSVDTEIDRWDLTASEDPYQAIFAAIEATSRWRTFVVETFPAQADLPEHLVDRGLQQCSDPVMSRLRTFRIKRPCEMSLLLERLLRILGTTASGELTTVEINSPSVLSFLAPAYPSIFHSVKVLSLDTPGLPNPVDLLPHLHQLEALTASHLSFPIYHDNVEIPCIHTLRHLTLRAVSIQWMSGRTFYILESCTILFPLRHHALHAFRTTLPNCSDLTFQGYPLDILHGVSTPKLTHLSVTSSSHKPRGSRQLVRFSSQALRESQLAPRNLHISIEAMSWAWTEAFTFMSNLDELVIENAQPSSFGVKVLRSLVVHRVHANNPGTTTTHGGQNKPACPSLKRFGLRYRRWLRPTEHFDLIPEFMSIIWSRQQSKCSLQSFRIWGTSDQKDPLELIGSLSLKGIEGLANVSAIKRGNLLELIANRLVEFLFKASRESSTVCPECNHDEFAVY